jgi:hypothetical protein
MATGKSNWASGIRDMLSENYFQYSWENQGVINEKLVIFILFIY